MTKTIMIKGYATPFIIKDISARRMNEIIKKHRNFFGALNAISVTEDIVFECLVSPAFTTKELMLEGMSPGQYVQLSKEVFTINGLEEDSDNENKAN